MGVDQVSLDLLEHQEQHDEPQRLPGIVDGDEQCAHSAPIKAPTMGIRAVRAIRTPTSRA